MCGITALLALISVLFLFSFLRGMLKLVLTQAHYSSSAEFYCLVLFRRKCGENEVYLENFGGTIYVPD